MQAQCHQLKNVIYIVVDKNKVMLPSIINNDTDNIIRTDARERA